MGESECLRTMLALETFLTGVDESVLLQTGGLGERPWALFTQKRFLPAVSSHVNFEVGRLHEGRRTELTPVWFFPFVHEGVALEAG